MRYSRSDVFERLTERRFYGRTEYRGKLKAEYVDILSCKDIADICEGYSGYIHYNIDIRADGEFACEIFTD